MNTRDRQTLLMGSSFGHIRNLHPGKGQKQFNEKAIWEQLHRDRITSLAYSANGRTVLSTSLDRSALLQSVDGKRKLATLQHTSAILSGAISPDGWLILTGTQEGAGQLWDASTGRPKRPPLLHQAEVYSVECSPDARMILTGSYDHTARLWDTATGKPMTPPLWHWDKVLASRFTLKAG